ncbi:MAG: hypothetical protein Q4G39_08590 [Brachymonas sp.]|nr:hypothetical protein [Brachymonas sp.]
MAVLLAVWMVMDYSILTAYAVAFSRFITPRLAALINKLSAVVLMLLAVYAFYKAMTQLV